MYNPAHRMGLAANTWTSVEEPSSLSKSMFQRQMSLAETNLSSVMPCHAKTVNVLEDARASAGSGDSAGVGNS
jgi:hypothetical protein